MAKQWMEDILRKYPGKWNPKEVDKQRVWYLLDTLRGYITILSNGLSNGDFTLVLDWEAAVKTLDELFEELNLLQLREDNRIRNEAVQRLVEGVDKKSK